MYNNRVEIVVKSQEGEILHQYAKDNAVSDDFIVTTNRIFDNTFTNGGLPVAFLLPDGSEWASYPGWDARNPWAPYTCTVSNSIVGGSTQPLYAGKTLSGPNSSTQYRWKMFYSWNNLPNDLQLKAVGLTGMQNDQFSGFLYGIANNVQINFCPETLVVLPTSFLVHGFVPGGVPDILELSYFISVVGAA
jgi:hypothetical protein